VIIDEIITAHGRFLRGEPGGRRAGLAFCDMSSLELYQAI